MTDQPAIEEAKDPYATPETDPLAKEWGKRISAARKHYEKFHKRVKHNRKLVAGFNWTKEPDSDDFYTLRANLIHGTITAILPNIYARNPEVSVSATHAGRSLKLLCKTIETVTNRQMVEADLKTRMKSTVRAAMTCSFGNVKVTYQRERTEDPIIRSRIEDTQDNISRVEALMLQLDDPGAKGEQEAIKQELEQTMAGLNEKVEIVAGEGITVDRVLTEHLLVDPSVAEFWDYKQADYIIQLIPTKKSTAEGDYKMKLDKAKTYSDPTMAAPNEGGKVFSGGDSTDSSDCMICICEIWDKRSQRVYTLVEGCDFFLRPPYSPPRVGKRWYPFFLLPFQTVDGNFVGPSLVDLTERLQKEHNDTRDKENAHRDLVKPGWVAGSDVNEKTIKRYEDSVLGEITIMDSEGKNIQQMIMPKQHPAIDPAVYDTSKVRYDWEQVSGMQDAARSSVVQAKTATEASIMQQSLSGRVSEMRDQVEDCVTDMYQYAAEILLQEMTQQQVERIMGPHKMGPLMQTTVDPLTGQPIEAPAVDPGTGEPIQVVIEPSYDWPQLSREEVFDMVQIKIRAGTTGEPDKMEQQETWIKLMPVIQPLITQIMDLQLKGVDTTSLEALLKETVARFDDKLDVEQIMPKLKPLPPPPMLPGAPPPMQ